jgi:hypothetical protein
MKRKPPKLDYIWPAIAGLLINHEVTRKDIYGTFINLIAKGYVGYTKEGDSFYFWATKKDTQKLLLHERRALEIFNRHKRPNNQTVWAFLDFGLDLNQFSEDTAQDAVNLNHYKKLTPDLQREIESAKGRLHIAILFFVAIIFFFVILDFSFFGVNPGWKNQLVFFVFTVIPSLITFTYLVGPVVKKILEGFVLISPFEKDYLGGFVCISKSRQKYNQLKGFLRRHEIVEKHWNNPYMAYAIVFGLVDNIDLYKI